MVPVPPRYWSRDSLQVNQSEERAERRPGQKLIANTIMRRVGTGAHPATHWPWEHFIAIMTKVGYWLLRQNFNMIIPLMTALDNLKFDCSEIFIQSISFYCSAGDNWGKPRKCGRNLRVIERMIPVVNSVIGSQCWLCERNIFIVLITLRFTQTLSCHLIWLVGRCIELGLSGVRSVCGQQGGCGAFLTSGRRRRPDTRRHQG